MTAEQPRTEAGRAMLMGDAVAGPYRIGHLDTCVWWKVGGQCDCGVLPAILAIEAEAARPLPEAQPLDVKRLAAALDVLSEDGLEYDLMAPEEREDRDEAAEQVATAYQRRLGALPDRPVPSLNVEWLAQADHEWSLVHERQRCAHHFRPVRPCTPDHHMEWAKAVVYSLRLSQPPVPATAPEDENDR